LTYCDCDVNVIFTVLKELSAAFRRTIELSIVLDSWIHNDPASKVYRLTSRANVGEVFPDPITPLNATAGFLHNLEPGWRDAFVKCGVWDHDIYDDAVPHNPLLNFNGYLYLNMSLMRLFGVRVPGFSPEAVDLQYFGDMPGIPSYESEARPGDENAAYSEKAGAWLVGEVLGATGLEELDEERKLVEDIVAKRPDLTTLSNSELVARITGFDELFRKLWCRHIEVSLKTGVGLGAVAQIAAAIGKPELALQLVGGIGDVDSARANYEIWPLGRLVAASPELRREFDAGVPGLLERLRANSHPDAKRFVSEFDAFLKNWGFRAPNEWELRSPTWGTQPEIALTLIDRLRFASESDSPATGNAKRAATREAATAAVREGLAPMPDVLAQFEGALNAAHLFSRGRERSRMTAALLVHEQRLAALELGRRAVAQGAIASPSAVFMLVRDELEEFARNPAPFADTLASREHGYLALFDVVPPFVVVGDPPPLGSWERRTTGSDAKLEPGQTVTAVSGSPGKATGRARVVLDPANPGDLEPGDIMIAPITDPSWTPLFLSIAGVVCNVGAPFSHAAIVSRELDIPCVVSVPNATNTIPDGCRIEIDGTAGTVTRLS
jgi:pyruvate,water dikinase